MGLPVTVYRWDDAGAPQLPNATAGKPSDIINVLKKCLVEGYGEKPSLGWSIPFEDAAANKIAFRNSTTEGSGGFVQFWDYADTDAAAGIVCYQTARSMTGLDAFIPEGYYNALKCENSKMHQWVIIGTSRAFYLIISRTDRSNMTSGVSYCFSGFFGDIEAAIPSDASQFIHFLYSIGNSTSCNWSTTMDYFSDGQKVCTMLDTDGGGTLSQQKLRFPFAASTTTAINGVPPVGLTLGKVLLFPPESTDRNGVKTSLSTLKPKVRGAFPGLYQFAEAAFSDQPWPQIITPNSKSYWMLKNGHAGASSFLINMDEWY